MSTTHIDRAEVMTELRAKQQQVWSSGDYNRIAALTVAVNETLVASAEVAPGEAVLDVATGTGHAALAAGRVGARVTGIDYVPGLLDIARQRAAAERLDVDFVEAPAEQLPFEDASFDGLTAAYLLRYLNDLPAGLRELARVLRPGATAALLDFGVPPSPIARAAWDVWVDIGLPLAGRAISPGWHEVGRFLGGSIRDFDERWPLPRLIATMHESGFEDVQARRLSLGGCTVLWGRRA